jgi:hypothetical protein
MNCVQFANFHAIREGARVAAREAGALRAAIQSMGSGIPVSSWPKTAQPIADFTRQPSECHKLREG